jgi:hypothetical protein
VGPSNFASSTSTTSPSMFLSSKQQPTTRPNIMSDEASDQDSPPPDYDMTGPCKEVLQSFADGHLTAAAAAPKLAALTIPDPNIDPEEIEEYLRELWQIILVYLARNKSRVKTIADLIWCLARLPPVLTESGEQLAVDDGCQRVWQDVPTLGWELRDEWNCEY